MTDYGTIKLPRKEYERHNERRKEMGLTWEAYINGEAPDTPHNNGVERGDLQAQLDRIESAATTAEDRTGNIQRTLEGLQR